MKIIENLKNKVTIGSLDIGSVFEYYGTKYLKIDLYSGVVVKTIRDSSNICLSIRLSDNTIANHNVDELVTPYPNATLILEPKE